jgi:cytochrome c peroxidase
MKKIVLIALIVSFFVSSCSKDVSLESSKPFGFEAPAHFPAPHYTFGENKLTKDGFELGRKLFFDPILSRDNSISCGSCHAQVHGFADHGAALSFGVDNLIGTRNSPGLFNLAWQTSFMWDGGVNHIEVFSVAPITNPLEMDESMTNVIEKLRNHHQYPGLFQKAFGTTEINDQRMLYALTQYMAMLISATAKYDKVQSGKASFTLQEQKGYDIFKQNCSSCHQEPLFTDYSFRNNGLTPADHELGRMTITLDENDRNKFKVPSLRNLSFTYPYMHDGRLYLLDDVLQHYSNNIQASSTLDPILQNGIPLSLEEREDLKSFLNTLNDYEFISNHKISEPKQ